MLNAARLTLSLSTVAVPLDAGMDIVGKYLGRALGVGDRWYKPAKHSVRRLKMNSMATEKYYSPSAGELAEVHARAPWIEDEKQLYELLCTQFANDSKRLGISAGAGWSWEADRARTAAPAPATPPAPAAARFVEAAVPAATRGVNGTRGGGGSLGSEELAPENRDALARAEYVAMAAGLERDLARELPPRIHAELRRAHEAHKELVGMIDTPPNHGGGGAR